MTIVIPQEWFWDHDMRDIAWLLYEQAENLPPAFAEQLIGLLKEIEDESYIGVEGVVGSRGLYMTQPVARTSIAQAKAQAKAAKEKAAAERKAAKAAEKAAAKALPIFNTADKTSGKVVKKSPARTPAKKRVKAR